MGATGDGDLYGRRPTNYMGLCRITDRNTVVERDEEGIRVSSKVINV